MRHTLLGLREKKLELSQLFGGKTRLVVGRAPDCDVCLPHPSVSRYHARFERRDGSLYLADLGSVNGVWLNGRRLAEGVTVKEGDRVGIGPYLLSVSGGVLRQLDNSKSLRLEAHNLEKVIRLPGGGSRKILDDVNLVVEPGEFVTLLGPSGCGKSTLMDALNGRRPATGGKVLANKEDFYKHFDSFRQSLGYVPQKDIVHNGLTVYRALHYTARLRLPIDTSDEEFRARIDGVMREMELAPHKDTLISNLSGGQIKRVSLGAELIGQPSMLYIDEATSGLDAGTETRMMKLFRRMADEGRSVVCITHNVDNVDVCHLILVLCKGKLMYYGPPAEAVRYFRIKRISEVYDKLAQRDAAEWEKEFRTTSLYREYVADRLAAPDEPAPATGVMPPEVAAAAAGARAAVGLADLVGASKLLGGAVERFRDLEASVLGWRDRVGDVRGSLHQFFVLTWRYLELIWGDRRGLRLLLLQAPIVSLFLLLGFVGQPYRESIPILRKLTDEERDALVIVKALNEKANEQEGSKSDTKVIIKVGGRTLPDDQAARVARQLTHPDAVPGRQQMLDRTEVIVQQPDGDETSMRAAEVQKVYRGLQDSSVADQLIHSKGSVVPDKIGINPGHTYVLLFVVVMIVLWFGCNNAAKEIVKEEAIYARERAVNLQILPYLASKFVVLTVITIFHAVILMAVLYGTMEVLAWQWPQQFTTPSPGQMLPYRWQFLMLVLLSMTGVALGLLLSACVSTPDRANALLPYVLIPQLILGGGIVAVNEGLLKVMAMVLSPVYWAYRGVHLGAGPDADPAFPSDFPFYRPYPDGMLLPCLALAAQALVLLLATAWFMKRKDV
jgi:ABC-type multidrug transport system ATPase subunit